MSTLSLSRFMLAAALAGSMPTLSAQVVTDVQVDSLPYTVIVPDYENFGEPLASAEFTSSDANFTLIHGDEVKLEATILLAKHRRRHLQESRVKRQRNVRRRQFQYEWNRAVRPNRTSAPLPEKQMQMSAMYTLLRAHTRSLISNNAEDIIRTFRKRPDEISGEWVETITQELALATNLKGQAWAPLLTTAPDARQPSGKTFPGDSALRERIYSMAKQDPGDSKDGYKWILFFDEADILSSIAAGDPPTTSAPVVDSLDIMLADTETGDDDPLTYRRDPTEGAWIRNWQWGLTSARGTLPPIDKAKLSSMVPPSLWALTDPAFIAMGEKLKEQLAQLKGLTPALGRQLLRETRRQRDATLDDDYSKPNIETVILAADYLYCRQIMLREFLLDTTLMQARIERIHNRKVRARYHRKARAHYATIGILTDLGFDKEPLAWDTISTGLSKGPGPVSILAIPATQDLLGEHEVKFETWVDYKPKGDKNRKYRAKSNLIMINLYESNNN